MALATARTVYSNSEVLADSDALILDVRLTATVVCFLFFFVVEPDISSSKL